MKAEKKSLVINKNKVTVIFLLFISAAAISISGIFFSIYSIVNDMNFTVINSRIHGAVFGMVILFLGLRYFISVQKLKIEVYKTTSRFSWNNFRKNGK